MSAATSEEVSELRDQVRLLTEALLGGRALMPTPTPPPATYSTEQVAELTHHSAKTVREWCRLGRVNAEKVEGWRRGPNDRWRIRAAELERIKSAGLLPVDIDRNVQPRKGAG